jgi:glycosyltransferase involved in cell wall biosynthesis
MIGNNQKTLIVSETPFYGGGEKFIEVFLELMGAEGLIFAIANETLTRRISSRVGPDRVLELDMSNKRGRALSAARLLGLTLKARPNRIILNGLPSLPILLAAMLTGRDIFIVVHTAIWNYHGTRQWPLYRRLLENFCTLIFVARHLESRSLVTSRKATHILQNRLLQDLVPATEFVPREAVKRILFIGRGSRSKGICEFLDAAKKLNESDFFIAGNVTENDIAEEIAARDNVTSLGFDKDIAQKFADYDLAIFPSHSEGFPYAVLEAARAGLPIVASDIPAHRELSGLVGPFPLFAVGDVAALVVKIRENSGFSARSDLSARLRERSKVFNDVTTYRDELRAIFRIDLEE